MDPARWRLIEDIYNRALSRAPGGRDAFLQQACGSDIALRDEVRSLLDQHASLNALLSIRNAVLGQMASESESDRTGQRLGVFELESRLGSGGMGEVYRARDTRLKRPVAIKILHSIQTDGSQLKRRLLREARAAAALDHPNICPIHEIGEADGVHFIVMPYIDGETLAQTIARRDASSPPPTESDWAAIVSQIAAALGEAHRHGIVHRDVKPANVMLTSRRAVKVLDFGLASATPVAPDGNTTLVDSTAIPGVVVGTVAYMSPEQVRGEPLDGRSDIFSLGVVAYELLTHRHPFVGPTVADTVSAILTVEPAGLHEGGEIAEDLRHFLRKCLQKHRADRYATIEDLLADLSSLVHDGRGRTDRAVAAAPVPPPMVAYGGGGDRIRWT